MTDVAEALQNEGQVQRNVAENTKELRRAVSIGIAVMVLSGIFFVSSLVMGTPEPSYLVQLNLYVAFIVFLLGLGWIAYSLWLRSIAVRMGSAITEKLSDKTERTTTAKLNHPDVPQLQPAYTPPATVEQIRELEEVPSVINNTTKLLKNEE